MKDRMIDAEIAKEIFGLSVKLKDLKHYSTKMADAWLIIEHVEKTWEMTKQLRFIETLKEIISKRLGLNNGRVFDYADTLLKIIPQDICLAALRSVNRNAW